MTLHSGIVTKTYHSRDTAFLNPCKACQCGDLASISPLETKHFHNLAVRLPGETNHEWLCIDESKIDAAIWQACFLKLSNNETFEWAGTQGSSGNVTLQLCCLQNGQPIWPLEPEFVCCEYSLTDDMLVWLMKVQCDVWKVDVAAQNLVCQLDGKPRNGWSWINRVYIWPRWWAPGLAEPTLPNWAQSHI